MPGYQKPNLQQELKENVAHDITLGEVQFMTVTSVPNLDLIE